MKKRPEEIVDQLLGALRDAESPAGMERRILHALEDRANVISPSKQHANATSTPRRWYWPAALGAVAATVLLLAFVLHRPAQRSVSVTAQSQLPTAPSPTQANASPTLVSIVSRATPPPAKKPALRHAAVLSAEEQLCLRELHAPSRPEPPEPLTAEEKTLLRIAQTAAPEEIAMLNPEIRAQQQAASAAEFDRFAQSSTNPNQQNR